MQNIAFQSQRRLRVGVAFLCAIAIAVALHAIPAVVEMIRVGKAVGLTCSLLTGFALALGGCGGDSQLVPSETPLTPIDSLEPPPDTTSPPPPPPVPPPDTVTPPPPDTTGTPPAPPPVHEGIAFGHYHLPPQLFSPKLSGVLRKTFPETILADLEAARRGNARVMLNLVGSEKHLRDEKGHFSFAVWKERVDRYRGLDISSYIADGTILAHYMIDQPQDTKKWGVPVPPSVMDEMAKYSKELWPGMATVVRGYEEHGVPAGYQYQYLDAGWAQYHQRFGDIDQFIRQNVQDAKDAGLALVVGLNMVAGGKTNELVGFYQGKKAMNASEVKSWGSALLAEPYVCAFISWRYIEGYFAQPGILAAIEELGDQARSLPKKDCRR